MENLREKRKILRMIPFPPGKAYEKVEAVNLIGTEAKRQPQ